MVRRTTINLETTRDEVDGSGRYGSRRFSDILCSIRHALDRRQYKRLCFLACRLSTEVKRLSQGEAGSLQVSVISHVALRKRARFTALAR